MVMKRKNEHRRKIWMIVSTIVMIIIVLAPFTTLTVKSEQKPMITFGILSDIQYCDCEAEGSRYYKSSLDKLKEAVQSFNLEKVDFTVQTGDLIDRDLSSFSIILQTFNLIKGPKYHVLGNHDFPLATKQMVQLLGMRKPYYDFTYKQWRFIVLDTNDISPYANPKGSKKYQQAQDLYRSLKKIDAINANSWNGGVSDEQLAWLRSVLKKSAKRKEKVIVYSHMPIYPESKHTVWNHQSVIKELEASGNVVAFFNGHYHGGDYAIKSGIHYITLNGMIETENTNSYAIVRIYNDRLVIEGFGREVNRVLEIQ